MKPTARYFLISLFLITQVFVTAQQYTKVNINNVSTYVWNDGRMDIDPDGNAGFEYWKGTKRFSVYASGVYWGGYIDNEIRIGGTKYRSSLKPGNEFGYENIHRTRPDYLTANLNGELNDENKSEAEIRKQYDSDYWKWPIKLGAPYNDINNDGKFTDGTDKPGFNKADQTLWLVCNDFEVTDYNTSTNPFYSKQTNVELQITTWAYSKDDLLKGVIFKSYKLINKSKTKTIKEMYLGVFTDPDIGNAGDDFAGCDTLLGLGYVLNANDNDVFFGKNLTTYGTLLLQSPIVNGTDKDEIFFNGKFYKKKKYVGMSTFRGYSVEISSFNILASNYATLKTAHPRYNPITKGFTNYPLSGDPVTKTGYLDGIIEKPGDRIIQINSGPFNMAPGDTQEVMFAQIVTSGTSRLGLVTYLKYLAKYVKDFYKNEMFKYATDANKPKEVPTQYYLSQNYPNPFNPETTIEYTLPVETRCGESLQKVTLKVFDLLGREVATLVDEYKSAGTYKVTFNTRHASTELSMTSGVYFYQLSAGSYKETKKLILMK